VHSYLDKLKKIKNLSFEIILVNDGSNDDTASIISNLASMCPEIKQVTLSSNEGPGIARNYGLKAAQFDYIWFLDDDDHLEESGIQAAVDFIADKSGDDSMVFAHSLLKKYSISLSAGTRKKQVLKNIILFREKQEVFNFVFSKNFLISNAINFSSGVHEDISFLVEALSAAEKIEIINSQIYKKELHQDSITFKMSHSRIEGFLAAYFNVLNLNSKYRYFDVIDIVEFRAQIFGVICYLITKCGEKSGVELLNYFIAQLKKWDLVGCLPNTFIKNDANLKYAASTLFHGVNDNLPIEILFDRLGDIFNSHLSCKDLDSSIFLGPNEIRACCKRFFVNGRQKGDVVLLPASPEIDLKEIDLSKKKLINEINREESIVCSGCPYIERVSTSLEDHKINYISLENFSYCNMRCTYCSPKYYDGTEAIYGANGIITELVEENRLADDCHIVWGGGEPTLSPTFGAITQLLLMNIGVGKVRVLSNSLKFSEKLVAFLADSRVHLVTSVDAGRQETFKEIRGKGKIDLVLANLARYLGAIEDKSRVTIKYIFTNENFHSDELKEFVSKISSNGLTTPLFQISCDFRIENPEDEIIFGFYELVARLHLIGIKYVFFDDLIRDRLNLTSEMADKVMMYLRGRDLPTDRIYSHSSNAKVVLWGRGLQSQWYINNTSYGKAGRILAEISSFSDLNNLNYSECKVMPSGIQSMYEIIKNIESSPVGANLVCPILL
jgi:glycosyltransferase involved in cell wall biosynthesis/organic radical activating enzyme